MKILSIGDPHGKLPKGLSGIVRKNKPDLIVVTGEIPPVPWNVYFPKRFKEMDYIYSDAEYKKLLTRLCSYKIPVIVLKGNAYRSSYGTKFTHNLFNKYSNFYYKSIGKFKIKDKNFVLFDMIWEKWAYKWKSKKFVNKMTKNNLLKERRISKLLKETENPILISHAPPYGYLDKIPSGKHVGSKVVLSAIKKYQPKLVLCGHIHEGRGRAKIGKSLIINSGSRGEYDIVEIK